MLFSLPSFRPCRSSRSVKGVKFTLSLLVGGSFSSDNTELTVYCQISRSARVARFTPSQLVRLFLDSKAYAVLTYLASDIEERTGGEVYTFPAGMS